MSIVSLPQADDTYQENEKIEVAVTFGDTVLVDYTVLVDTARGTPTIAFNLFPPRTGSTGSNVTAGYARGSGTNRLVFTYTVKMADYDGDGVAVIANGLALNGGTITSVNGAKALLLYDGVEGSSSHKVDGRSAVLDLALGVCDRTPQIRDALVARVAGADDCSEVTNAYLAAITGTLNLDGIVTGSRMTGLKAGDFEGLSGVTVLHLSNNRLRDVPAGVFDPLTA